MPIPRSKRGAVVAALESRNFDPKSVRIARNGDVSAVKSADRTLNGDRDVRVHLGTVEEILWQAVQAA